MGQTLVSFPSYGKKGRKLKKLDNERRVKPTLIGYENVASETHSRR